MLDITLKETRVYREVKEEGREALTQPRVLESSLASIAILPHHKASDHKNCGSQTDKQVQNARWQPPKCAIVHRCKGVGYFGSQ